ncbi:MAG: FG-GAP repeat domain-containing protein [Candidatus Thorarchaeota archaeon]
MAHLDIISAISLKEAVTSLNIIDVTGDGKAELVITTIKSDIRALKLEPDGAYTTLIQVNDIPPVTVIGAGDVTGDSHTDLVMGNLDNKMRVINLQKDTIISKCECPLGTLPTAICVTNVMGDEKTEVIVATDDKALRCFGWYGGALDKLAHKVVEYPVFSIEPYRNRGVPYTQFIFGDASSYIFFYQYADDRLHERGKIKARAPVDLVATGSITGSRYDEIVAIMKKNISVFGPGPNGIEFYDNVRAPGTVSSVKIGNIIDGLASPGQAIVSQTNSLLTLFSLDGRRLVEECTIKTRDKAAESIIGYGDVDGDGRTEIVQAAGNNIYILSVSE